MYIFEENGALKQKNYIQQQKNLTLSTLGKKFRMGELKKTNASCKVSCWKRSTIKANK